jgi:mRNA-degrading endonuclease HigB of HigAB toxin-antitoxin module
MNFIRATKKKKTMNVKSFFENIFYMGKHFIYDFDGNEKKVKHVLLDHKLLMSFFG